MAAVTSAIVATSLAASMAGSAAAAIGAGGLLTSAMVLGAGAAGAYGGYKAGDYLSHNLGDWIPGTLKTKTPEEATPPVPVSAGEEGIRRGSMIRETNKRALTSLYLTQGQTRAEDATLGGYRKTLA